MAYNEGTFWEANKHKLAILPAVIFFAVSMLFFMVGLKFNKPFIVFGQNITQLIAIGLTLANTVVQLLGNDAEDRGKMTLPLLLGWYGSYALGIGTNIAGILDLLDVGSLGLNWLIAVGLGTMIEVLPERLILITLKGSDIVHGSRSVQYKNKSSSRGMGATYNAPRSTTHTPPMNRPTQRPAQTSRPAYKPLGMRSSIPPAPEPPDDDDFMREVSRN